MSRQADAMRRYFEANGIALRDVASAIGVKPATISNMLADRDKIGKIRAKRLKEAYGFNYIFLLTGDGDLFGGPAPTPTYQQSAGVNNGTMQQGCPDVSDLMQRIDQLTEDLKAKEKENTWLRNLVDRLAPEGK